MAIRKEARKGIPHISESKEFGRKHSEPREWDKVSEEVRLCVTAHGVIR